MLGKVIKYELKSSSRLLVPLFVLSPVLALMLRLMFDFAIPAIWSQWAEVSYAVAYMLIMFLVGGISFMVAISLAYRYYKSMSSNEAYLTFTLPVKRSTLILGKNIVAAIYSAVSVMIIAMCLGLMYVGSNAYKASDFSSVDLVSVGGKAPASILIQQIPATVIAGFVVFMIILMILSVYYSINTLYTCVAIGSLMNGNRLLGTVVSYFALNVVEGFLMVILLLVIGGIPVGILVGSKGGMEGMYNWMASSSPHAISNMIFGLSMIIMGISALIMLLFSLIHYFVNKNIFTKRLNLE